MSSDSQDGAPVGPYAPVTRAGDLLLCSGQLGLDDGAIVSGGVGRETAQAIRNLAAVLEREGATLRDVVKTTVFLVDIDQFDTMNSAYIETFGDHRPSRSAVAVVGLPRGAHVEVEAVVYLPQEHQ